MDTNCDKFPFDYTKHITLKAIVTSEFRHFTQNGEIFQGISVTRCDKCLIQGYEALSIPFKFDNISNKEINCTLKRMGLYELTTSEALILTELEHTESGALCESCLEILEYEETLDN